MAAVAALLAALTLILGAALAQPRFLAYDPVAHAHRLVEPATAAATPLPRTSPVRASAPASPSSTPSSEEHDRRPGTSGFGLLILGVLVAAALYLTTRLRRRR